MVKEKGKSFFLGVDGGGTKTAAVLVKFPENEVKTTRRGPGNVAVLDRGSIARLIRQVLSDLVSRQDIEFIQWATFAFAGAGRSEERHMVESLIRGAGIHHFTIMTDAEILYYSVFGDDRGILLSAGTGSICLIRDRQGNFHQIGGWGYLLGDEGSGYFIGHRAIKSALHEAEIQQPPSRLTKELLSFYGIEQPQNLITVIYSSINSPNLIASCAPLVCELAEEGEPTAHRIVEEASEALLNLVDNAVQHFGQRESAALPLCLAGSILTEVDIVQRLFKEKASERGYRFHYIEPQMEPAAAAVVLAMQKAGYQPSQPLLEKLRQIQFS